MKRLSTSFTNQLPTACAEFRIGVRSAPYLVDHGFQDMVVLPGSFLIDMALCVDRERFNRVPGLVRDATFHSPIILSEEDSVIRVEVNDHGDGRSEYMFYEAGAVDGSAELDGRQSVARLEIDRNCSARLGTKTGEFSIEAFQARAHVVIDSSLFYTTLRENGNQYGPRFQNVSAIWRAGDQALGRISMGREHREMEPHCLHPSLLDSMTQLLAPLIREKGKTFILRAIERMEVTDINLPETLWGHATLLPGDDGDDKGFRGNVRVFDPLGKLFLELSGVAFALVDHSGVTVEKAAANLVIASNFTAEPLEDSLNFWGDHFGVQMDIEFAPYNQLFQQLLDRGSAFHRNDGGINVFLLGLEEWVVGDRHAVMEFDRERVGQVLGARKRCVLPNGLEIAHLNGYETDYVYKEIFEDQCYLRHGICLKDGATVVDIGANIGLFSLFVMSRCAGARIYAFEPSPVVYDLLKANCDAYGSNVHAFNAGVSDKPKTARFTFYQESSVFSGFHSDEAEDRAAIQAVVRNMLRSGSVAGESVEEYVNELTADRLNSSTHECQLTSVSEIIRTNQIDSIDLLKIDAEKSELDIINGIDDCHWPKIKQIVIEIHDPTREAAKRVERLLIERGYRCAVEQETLLEHAGLFNLYATRGDAGDEMISGSIAVAADAPRINQARRKLGNLKRNTQEFGGALRSFIGRAKAPVVLCFCPRTPAAQSDPELMSALNDAEEALISATSKSSSIHAISSELLLRRYPVKDYYDPHGHHVAHMPYTPACYAAIGTELVRTIYNLKRGPFKVIVLDCDNTLWKGVCGEDGPLGVQVTAPYRALQEIMVGQMKAGVLLCLCSKNNEKDALDVFDQRSDMPLKREHLVSWRINWKSKSENIKSLARELNLGLDSFIFIDDNPVDCADVKINCPSVLTLQLPGNAESIPSFLDHIWAFDHMGSTQEDQKRTRLYTENAKRERYREQALSLREFIKGLQLRIDISQPTDLQLERVSQLTFRTNQFNFTTLRRSKSEIQNLLKRDDANCMVVSVADRFGDYGLVGVLIYEIGADRFKVDTLLLSCRVLGRGVEHSLVARLGQWAVNEGKKFVEFAYSPTEKNAIALEFIKSIGEQYRNTTNRSWLVPAERLASVEYNPDESAPGEGVVAESDDSDRPAARSALAFDGADRSECLQTTGETLCEIDRLVKAIEEYRIRKQPRRIAAHVTPGNEMEIALANIWMKVLGKPVIGMNDNFFEAGGTSLRAVQVIAMIKKELGKTLSIVSLFECPTVRLLSAKLSATSGEAHGWATTAVAAQRGQQRRYNTVKQKTS